MVRMPAWAAWHPSTPYTVGIEEEVMLVDPASWGLAERAAQVLANLGDDLIGHCSAETHEAALELVTRPWNSVAGAIAELEQLRGRLLRTARAHGLAVLAAGVYPGRGADESRVSPAGRYQVIDRTMRGLAHREPTFALHVHIGVADADSAIVLVNRMRAHLPMLLALSASSPLWRGRATGLASNRAILFQAFPRTGVPRRFAGYRDWVETVDLLLRSGAIPEPTFLWWDVRPQPRFGTVEVRIMDAQPRTEATGALCALILAIARLELEEGYAATALVHAQELLAENRFLAARDGAAAAFIDPVRVRPVALAEQLADLLAAAAPHAEALGVTGELAHIWRLVSRQEPARQKAKAAATGVGGLVADLADIFEHEHTTHQSAVGGV